jgi:hyperosmotically inducible protein
VASIKLSVSEDWSQLLVFLSQHWAIRLKVEKSAKLFPVSKVERPPSQSERFCTAVPEQMSDSWIVHRQEIGAFSRIQSRYDERTNMKTTKLLVTLLMLIAIGVLVGCSASAKSPDVSDSIRKSLDQAGFKDVSVSQDRDKGVVTLGGQVASENGKAQAESLAKSFAGAQVVADQIAVIPVGAEKAARAVNSDLDRGIENNLDAALIQNKMNHNVKYEVKSGVVTLTGELNSEGLRSSAEKVAAGVPNVLQVVNDLQVKDQKASSSR